MSMTENNKKFDIVISYTSCWDILIDINYSNDVTIESKLLGTRSKLLTFN